MATIKYRLHSKSNNAPIYLQLSAGRNKYTQRKTGLSINSKDWSIKTGLPLQNNPINKNLSNRLKKLETFIFDKLNDANSIGVEVTGDWLSHNIDLYFGRIADNNKSELVIDNIQQIINTAHTRDNGKKGIGLTECRINAYKRLKTLFNEFQDKNNYKIKELDVNLFDNFKTWLLDKKTYAPTYALKKLADLKTFIKSLIYSCNDPITERERIMPTA